MTTAAEILLVVATAVTFVVRFAVALYHARADGDAAKTYQRRRNAELIARDGRPNERTQDSRCADGRFWRSATRNLG